eukprot:Sspe_Gene.60412::Locus_33298_Transcript_3_4_Confidence_0.200_Length_2145::g.60412::m.60412
MGENEEKAKVHFSAAPSPSDDIIEPGEDHNSQGSCRSWAERRRAKWREHRGDRAVHAPVAPDHYPARLVAGVATDEDIEEAVADEYRHEQLLALSEKNAMRIHLRKIMLKEAVYTDEWVKRIWYAARHGDVEPFKVLVRCDPRLLGLMRLKDTRGRTPLHIASREGYGDIIQTCLRLPPACLRGEPKEVGMEEWIETNAVSTCKAVTKRGYTPFHYAVVGGHVRVVEYMLQYFTAIGTLQQELYAECAEGAIAVQLAATYEWNGIRQLLERLMVSFEKERKRVLEEEEKWRMHEREKQSKEAKRMREREEEWEKFRQARREQEEHRLRIEEQQRKRDAARAEATRLEAQRERRIEQAIEARREQDDMVRQLAAEREKEARRERAKKQLLRQQALQMQQQRWEQQMDVFLRPVEASHSTPWSPAARSPLQSPSTDTPFDLPLASVTSHDEALRIAMQQKADDIRNEEERFREWEERERLAHEALKKHPRFGMEVSGGVDFRLLGQVAFPGVKVVEVDAAGPAAIAGLVVGDCILAVNRTKTPSLMVFRTVLEDISGREMVELEVLSEGGGTRTVQVLPEPCATLGRSSRLRRRKAEGLLWQQPCEVGGQASPRRGLPWRPPSKRATPPADPPLPPDSHKAITDSLSQSNQHSSPWRHPPSRDHGPPPPSPVRAHHPHPWI